MYRSHNKKIFIYFRSFIIAMSYSTLSHMAIKLEQHVQTWLKYLSLVAEDLDIDDDVDVKVSG